MKEFLVQQRKTIYFLIGSFVIIILAYRYFAPFGKMVSYRFNFKGPGTQEVTSFSPGKEGVLKIPQQIVKNSSRFSVDLTSPNIESINAKLKFKPFEPLAKEAKLGVRGNEKDNFVFKPLYNSLIQGLNWAKIEEKGFTIWQREKTYNSLNEFISNSPKDKKVAFYYVDQSKLITTESSEDKKDNKVIIDTPLRGDHTLLIRVTKNPLIVKIIKQDNNGYKGEDKLKITVSMGETTLLEKTMEDDGIVDTSGLKTTPQEETISLDNIDPGIYKVNLTPESEGADYLIQKIEINQKKVVFKSHIFFLGNKATTLWTNVNLLNVTTYHEGSLQTIKLNNEKELQVKEVNKKYPFNLETLSGKKSSNSPYKLESPKNDLIFEGEGYFSFAEDSFFNPEVMKSVDLNNLNDLNDIDFVFTSYQQAKKEEKWLVSNISFDPKTVKVEGDKLYFSLEISRGSELEIEYLEVSVKEKGALEKNKK